MVHLRCRECGAPITAENYFCGNCGAPTSEGLHILAQRDKSRRILRQLDLAYQAGKISQAKYEAEKRTYLVQVTGLEVPVYKTSAEPSSAPMGTNASDKGIPLPKDTVRSVVYANPPPLPWRGIVWYVLAAAFLFFASVFLVFYRIGGTYEWVWLHQWYLLAFSFTGPVIYLTWMYRNDKFEREPLYLLALIVGWGAFAGLLSFFGNSYFSSIGLGFSWLSAPLVEESMKGIGVYVMSKNLEFNDSLDGIVYGFAAGAGFAWVENFFYIVYVYKGDLLSSLLRVFVFGYGHGLYTALTGRLLGEAKVRRGYTQTSDLLRGLIPAMLAHGFYNSYLIEVFGFPQFESFLVWLLLTHGLVTVVVYAYIRRAWVQERSWFYDRGLAPTGRRASSGQSSP